MTPGAADRSDSRPLRVAMVIQRFRPYFAGQGVQVEALCRALAKRGVETAIVTAVRAGDAPAVERTGPTTIHRLRADLPFGVRVRRLWSPLFALRTFAWLWRRRRSLDVIHVHALTDALYAAWTLGRLCGIPVIFEMTLLGADDPISVQGSTNRLRRLRYWLYSRCDAWVAISPALAARHREAGLPSDRLRLIPQGVDVERFRPAPDRQSARQKAGLPPDGALVAFVGSLVERKGVDVLLGAWERIHAARPDAHLVLVGKDRFPEDPAADRFLADHLRRLPDDARSAIVRLGLRDDVADVLAAADVFVLPSRREGFGTVIVEAMACGLPCVVAEMPGITDFIFEDGPEARGLVVAQEDPTAVSRAVLGLLADPAHAAAIGRAARARAERAFAFDGIAGRYVACYEEVLRTSGRAVPR